MKRTASMLAFVVLVFASFVAAAGAQTLIGTVQGKVLDQQGGVLPGVTVTLVGPRGAQTMVTDGQGEYRFVGVQPGTYAVKVELSGFLPQEQRDVAVSINRTISVDFTLKVGGVTETIEVLGTASTVDVRSSSTETSLSSQLLEAMPIYSSTSTGLLNYAPGINSSSAYGGQGSYGNALLLDGVDTRDPEGGSAWTFFNQNLIEEIQIGGLGAPAEYGGFTGAVVNTITKSGGNNFSGLFSIRYTNKDLAGDNVTSGILRENPSLGQGDIFKKLADYTVQMGGPIRKDKAFFFASIQRYSEDSDPIGPRTSRTDISPRFNVKATLQPTPSDTIILGMQYDQYNVTGRVGYWPTAQAGDAQTVEEDAPEWVWNAQYRKIFGTNTLLEAKFTGYNGYYYLDPVDPSPFTYDGATGEYSGGGGGLYRADRGRNQANVSLTNYAEKFGRHSLKFGAEIERSHVRSQYQPYGPAGFYIYAYGGVPYYQISYGYDVQGDNRRTSIYAQDQWNLGRLTMNLGVRLDRIRGYSPVLNETVYTPKSAWGPRLGVAYDVTGKGNTVLRGFWGRYYEGPASAFFTSATPGILDYAAAPIYEDGSLGPKEVWIPGSIYGIDPDIAHPRTDEISLAWEQQIRQGLQFTATGIWRTTGNFINNVITGSLWEPVQLTNALTNQPYTAWAWANDDETSENFYITNVDGFEYRAVDGSLIGTAQPERKYRALMLLLTKSLRDRWGFQASYVLSKAEGTMDNSGFGSWLGGSAWGSPNTAIINNYGELTNSRRHEIKLYLNYQIPKIDVMVSPSYTGLSGRPYAAYAQLGSSTLNLPGSGRRQIFLEPRGSKVNDFVHYVDLRAEKYFKFGPYRLGIYMDATNLFNASGITARQTRYPSTSIGGNTVLYQAPTGVQSARQITFGGRWSF